MRIQQTENELLPNNEKAKYKQHCTNCNYRFPSAIKYTDGMYHCTMCKHIAPKRQSTDNTDKSTQVALM